MTKDDSELKVIGQSWEIWDFLTKKTGLDPDGYDQLIVAELCKQLNILPPCKNLKTELKKRKISTELFIGAFLKAFQPYAQMMSDLCVFFYLHGIKKTNQELKILFDFGQGPEDLGFDLRHFREVLWKYKRVLQSFSVFGWNHNTLWMLNSIFREYQRDILQDSSASLWRARYVKVGEFGYPYPTPPMTEIDEIDRWMSRVWNVWITIVSECKKYGNTRQDLRSHAELYHKRPRNIDAQEDSYDQIRRCQELPRFEDWDAWTIFVLDSDRWPESLLNGIFGFIEHININSTSKDERMSAASDVLHELEKLFSGLPHRETEKEVLEKELLELLNLPIWKRRHELYQTWVLSQIDNALKNYERVIHHVNGHLVFSFSGTHIGTIETVKGRLHLWSELRSYLANPIGKGRKSHIQPDYTLTFEPISEPCQTVMAIECKQYKKASAKNFSEALIDYANGRINARVVLVNYGTAARNILNSIDDNIRPRTSIIGNLMPGRSEEIDEFCSYILSTLPDAVSTKSERNLANNGLCDLIIVDVSGSMSSYFSSEPIINIIKLYATSNPKAKLLAVDTTVKKKWDDAGKNYDEILRMSSGGNTDISDAISSYNIKNAIIITDADGWSQVSHLSPLPLLTIEILNKTELVFHYRN